MDVPLTMDRGNPQPPIRRWQEFHNTSVTQLNVRVHQGYPQPPLVSGATAKVLQVSSPPPVVEFFDRAMAR